MSNIAIHYGTDPMKMTIRLMEQAEIQVPATCRVVIKPNLVLAKPADSGATTHPEIVEGIIVYLREACGVQSITIAEGSWVGDSTQRAFSVCGYEELGRRLHVPLVDSKHDQVVKVQSHGFELELCRTFAEADYFINVPVLKGHCQTGMTCCLKNLKGCIPDRQKRRFHTVGLHAPIAALACALRPHLHIVDSICGDLSFEEGGNPVDSHRILLGHDPVLLDSYGAALLGYRPGEVEPLRIAGDWGAGRFADDCTQVLELGKRPRAADCPPRATQVRKLGQFVAEDGACSACYSSLMYALNQTGGRMLRGEKLCIGQGYRDRKKPGLYGVGNCAGGCDSHVPGCPPQAVDIVDYLLRL